MMFKKRSTDRLGKKCDMLYEKKEIIMKKMWKDMRVKNVKEKIYQDYTFYLLIVLCEGYICLWEQINNKKY